MTTYDTLVSDELLPELSNDNPAMPAGFRIVGLADGPAGNRQVRLRVEDDNAPDWTQGRLVTPVFTRTYVGGRVTRDRITGYHLETEPTGPAGRG